MQQVVKRDLAAGWQKKGGNACYQTLAARENSHIMEAPASICIDATWWANLSR